MRLVGHMLDDVLDHMIIGLVTTALYWAPNTSGLRRDLLYL